MVPTHNARSSTIVVTGLQAVPVAADTNGWRFDVNETALLDGAAQLSAICTDAKVVSEVEELVRRN